MTDETYNGWTNYPTWVVNLWLGNDEGLYDQTQSVVAQTLDELYVREPFTREQAERYEVAESIKNFVTHDLVPDLGASFATDLLDYALTEVDWIEIADAWIESVKDASAV